MKTIKVKPIFDIFSKREKTINQKNNTEPKQKIIADYREKNSLVPSELISLGLEVEFKELKVADFLVRNIAIERKTVSDFISSMINKRLLRQLEELQQYESKLLIIEGFEEQELYQETEEKIGMHSNAIRGFILSILLNYKVPIIFSKNYEDTAKYISIIAKKQKNELSINPKKKSRDIKEQIQYIIEGFPGIGPKSAKKLLNKFGSIKNIINAPEEELKKILGIKGEKFHEIIGHS